MNYMLINSPRVRCLYTLDTHLCKEYVVLFNACCDLFRTNNGLLTCPYGSC